MHIVTFNRDGDRDPWLPGTFILSRELGFCLVRPVGNAEASPTERSLVSVDLDVLVEVAPTHGQLRELVQKNRVPDPREDR
jgi:hypothetical protein